MLNNNKKFKTQLNLLNSFVRDEQWLDILSFYIAFNSNFSNKIYKYINKINNNINLVNIENIIKEIRFKTIKLISKGQKENDILNKWLIYLEAYAWYGFIETITEGSIITDYIFDKLKEKYKDKYLKVLKDIDNNKPSKLNKFKISKKALNYKDEIVDLYLLMKYWQDDQHVFQEKELIFKYKEAKQNFINMIKDEYPHLNGINHICLVALYMLDNLPIIPIDLITNYILSGIKDYLVNIIGGKAIGLSLLKVNEFNIPNTYFISITSLKNKLYLKELKKLNINNYAVRSSANVEDNSNYSFAGLFTSKLDVKEKDLEKAIIEVSDSISNNRVNSYIKKLNIDRKPYMSIILQECVNSDISGVWMGKDLNSGRLEWIQGMGEKLVSGKVTPNFEEWNSNTMKEVLTINNKEIGKLCLELQNKINIISDLEWCIYKNNFILLQLRPVTRKVIEDNYFLKKDGKIYGIPASSGIIKGKPIFLKDIEESNTFEEGAILITDYTDPDWIPVIIKSKAIVTAEGGALSHTAIISRELAIPCIVGIGYDNIDKLKNKNQIQVNGDLGIIEIINKDL